MYYTVSPFQDVAGKHRNANNCELRDTFCIILELIEPGDVHENTIDNEHVIVLQTPKGCLRNEDEILVGQSCTTLSQRTSIVPSQVPRSGHVHLLQATLRSRLGLTYLELHPARIIL
jgi:hypothetical protein